MLHASHRSPPLNLMNDTRMDDKQKRLFQEVMKLSAAGSKVNVFSEFQTSTPLQFPASLSAPIVLSSNPTPPASSSSSSKKQIKVEKASISDQTSPKRTPQQAAATSSEVKKKTPATPKTSRVKAPSPPTAQQQVTQSSSSSSTVSGEVHYSGSAFENAPEASELPLPFFEEQLPTFFTATPQSEVTPLKMTNTAPILIIAGEQSSVKRSKAESLKRFLKVRKG